MSEKPTFSGDEIRATYDQMLTIARHAAWGTMTVYARQPRYAACHMENVGAWGKDTRD